MISTFILILLLLWSAMSFLPGVQRLITNALGITSDGNNDASSSARGSNPSSHNSASQPNNGSSDLGNAGYEPSALDVVVVKIMLTKGCNLPHEIVLSLLDHAEYWPHTTTTLDRSLTVSSGPGREDKFLVSDNHQARDFVFTNRRLVSFDQNHSASSKGYTTTIATTASPLLRLNHSPKVENIPCRSSRSGLEVQPTLSSTLAARLSSPCAVAIKAGEDVLPTEEATVDHGHGSRPARSGSKRTPHTPRIPRRRSHPLKAPSMRRPRAVPLSARSTRSQPRIFQYTPRDPFIQPLSPTRKHSITNSILLPSSPYRVTRPQPGSLQPTRLCGLGRTMSIH